MRGVQSGVRLGSGYVSIQTNQIAINVHVQPGGELVTSVESHIYKYEGGGIAKNTGASVRLIHGNRGRLTLSDVEESVNPDDVHFPVTQLVCLEDTSNRGGGAIYDFEEIKKISTFCKDNRLPLHLDGARLMNAMVENGVDLKQYATQFDSISLCLSKGLGAPVGSLLLGSNDFIKQSRRVRKVFGGGMRQAGIIAAGGLYALKNNIHRLKEDHAHAKTLEASLNALPWVKEVVPVETNIVVAILEDKSKRDLVINELSKRGIKIMGFGPGMLRFVTHMDVCDSAIDQTVEALNKLIV